jgi:predicted kinase/mannose-6-phosphate isomerase-like protein (cupin superfamily)
VTRPVLICPIGLPGAGKSTLLDALAPRLPGMRRLSRDAIRWDLFAQPVYDTAEKQRILAVMLERAAAHLAAGEDVALDGATFSRQADRDAVAALARRRGAGLVIALCELPLAEAEARIAADVVAARHSAQDRRPGLAADVAARFDPPGPDVLRLDMTQSPEAAARALAAAVEAARLAPTMAQLIPAPSVVEAAGTKPKIIEEFVGRVNTGEPRLSVARMRSPEGWEEPGQRPEFDEYTLVLHGCLRVESEDGSLDVRAGQAVLAPAGAWVRYSTPEPGGAEYVAICLPAFAPETVHRDA